MVEVTREKLKDLNYRFSVKSGHFCGLHNFVMGNANKTVDFDWFKKIEFYKIYFVFFDTQLKGLFEFSLKYWNSNTDFQ